MKEWVIGLHAVSEILKQRPDSVVELLVSSDSANKRLSQIRELAQSAGIGITEADKKRFDRQFKGVHQGVAAQVQGNKEIMNEKQLLASLENEENDLLLLILDGVTDPHNLGACLRTADAAGVHAVIVPKDKAAPLNETARKVACGAAETVNFAAVSNLARCMDALKEKGVWMIGTADESASPLYQQDLTGHIALVMGSEGTGLRRLTRQSCDHEISIPMAGAMSSLNVSVATGIALFEAVRQRKSK